MKDVSKISESSLDLHNVFQVPVIFPGSRTDVEIF